MWFWRSEGGYEKLPGGHIEYHELLKLRQFSFKYGTSNVSDMKKGPKMHIFNFSLPEIT